MSTFSAFSREQLESCDARLQAVFNHVIIYFDCKVLEGHRNEALQRLYFRQHKSKVDWPDGKHNSFPSMAADVMPYPVDWRDTERICYFAGFVMATALSMGIKIRWGKDWDGDTDLNDQKFCDSPHYELVVEA